MTSSVTEVLTFVQVSETVWDGSATPSSTPSNSNATRLVGHYTWPFSLTLPTHCQLKASNGETRTHRLPSSFSERMARVHIQYQILVTVHRSRFRVDSTCVNFPRPSTLLSTFSRLDLGLSSDTLPSYGLMRRRWPDSSLTSRTPQSPGLTSTPTAGSAFHRSIFAGLYSPRGP